MVQSLSIRVPWHDYGWTGCVCTSPDRNQACRVLKNIALKRADTKKSLQCEGYAGDPVISEDVFAPPCLTESGQFMSDHEMTIKRQHPYATFHEQYTHIKDTFLLISPFSFTCIPFKWTLKDKDGQGDSPNSRYYTGYDPNIEISVTKKDSWITNGENQRRIFEYFFRNLTPKESMVVAYAKAVPFIETSGRIVIGIGFVESIGELREYDYSETPTGKQATACLWERNVGHSIRADRKNGFLSPLPKFKST
jgi:hypothetical protein